jgi:hypothetical protein
MVPRVTMLLAVDSLGHVWLSLAQANSNRQIFGMFLRHLALKLDQEDPDWRESAVLLLDGAAYHAAAATKELMHKLRLPVMMLGPYSYEASPCELYFAAFKKADVNPRHVPTSKGHFDAVVRLVLEQCRQIPKHQLLLHWHHCLLYVYRYLSYHRL